ncbi:MAG: VWA domain-containing protein [Proteobacteria bacterium]|nr:VWA domain-containing protein [Pseudomonadota bacterium]
MDVTFARFVHALRSAGVAVSPAETLDGFAVIQHVGVHDPVLLQNALSLTFAKSREEKASFSECFDRFFHQLAFSEPPKRTMLRNVDAQAFMAELKNRASEDAQTLIASILKGDQNTLAYQVQQIAGRIHIQDMHNLREKSGYAEKIAGHLHVKELQTLAGESTGASAVTLNYLRQYITSQVREFVNTQYQLLVDSSGKKALIDAALKSNLDQLSPAYYADVEKVVKKLADRLAQQHRRRRKRTQRGVLDLKRLLRDNIAYDGVMFRLAFRQRKNEPSTVYVVCDVSNSVARVARFLLLLLHNLADLLPNLRSFAFSNQLGEVTDLFEAHDHTRAIEETMILWGKGTTDYGRALLDFRELVKNDLDHRSTVIFLGDARSNYFDPRIDVLKAISKRVKQVFWLNPESRETWGVGDSEMLRYSAHCLQTDVCHRLTDIDRFADRLINATR